jgi:hypothetical protein
LFLGRRWLLRQLLEGAVRDEWRGALILGAQGSGKTALLLQLVEHSCFGRRHAIYNRPASGTLPLMKHSLFFFFFFLHSLKNFPIPQFDIFLKKFPSSVVDALAYLEKLRFSHMKVLSDNKH